MKRFLCILFLLTSFNAFAQMKIVATYPPIQSLVAQITDDVYPVNLLHTKAGPHHDVQLKPSQMKTLQNADIVFWVGEDLETYLPDTLKSIAPKALSVPLIQNEKLKLKNSVSNPKQKDVHFWMNVDNAIATLDYIEQIMAEKDPANKNKFAQNKQKAIQYFDTLKDSASVLSKKRKFVALHDGFDYFFDYFDLNGTTLGIEPENLQTPQQIQNFKKQLTELNPDCIIIEPSLTRREKSALGLDKYALQKADAIGWNIAPGTGHLYKTMRWTISQMRRCSKK